MNPWASHRATEAPTDNVFDVVFELIEYETGHEIRCGHVSITPHEMTHRITAHGFRLQTPAALDDVTVVPDDTPHRRPLPSIYNRYQRSTAEDDDLEAVTALFRPLFALSFLVDAWLDDHDMFGVTSLLLTSASSKTAIGLAHLIATERRCTVIGLTSPGHAEFVRSLGVYDRTVTYPDLGDLPGAEPAVLVDLAGDGAVVDLVHRTYGERLRQSIRVGVTHHAASTAVLPTAASADRLGPEPTFFFAPDHVEQRVAEWGPGRLAAALADAGAHFDAFVAGWLEIDRRTGADAIVAAWGDVLAGRADPRCGVIW